MTARFEAGSPNRRLLAEEFNARGAGLLAAGDVEGAAGCFARAVNAAPDWAEPRKNLGNCYLRVQDPAQAAHWYEQALALDQEHLASWNNLGNACRYLGQLDRAEQCLRRAAALAPADPDVVANLGAVLLAMGRNADACMTFQAALMLQPQDLVALNGMGNAAAAAGDHEVAADHYRRALAVNPGQAETRLALASQYRALGRSSDAISLLAPMLPADANACALAGNAALDIGDLDAAASIAREALAVHPGHRESMYLLGAALYSQGASQAAARQWEQTLALHPDCAEALSALLHHKLESCDWNGLAQLKNKALELAVGTHPSDLNPFDALLADLPGPLRLGAVERLVSRRYPGRPDHPVANQSAGGRIRLGYLSGDFCRHPLPTLVRQLLASHDRRRFEVFAYSLGTDDGSAEREAIRCAVDCFRDLNAITDSATAARIREDGIDILIDLSGFTERGRPGVLALRPAPVSVNWLGFIGSLGSLADVIIADAITIPPREEADYGERVLRLSFFQPNDTDRFAGLPQAAARTDYGLPAHGVVFCCFSPATKLNPQMLDAWAAILREVPGSVLWLLAFAPAIEANLLAEWSGRGMAADRLVFAQRVALKDYLARMSVADLFLDTLPMSNGTTAADALFMGVPLLTCRGTGYCGKMGASVATAAGLAELVTPDLAAYVKRGIELGKSPDELVRLKARLQDARNRRTVPLFHPETLTRELEAAFAELAGTTPG